MSEPTPISLGIRSNPARNRQGGYARLTNCFAEEQGEEGKTTWMIYGTAGLANFGSAVAGGGIREMIAVGGKAYIAAGRNIYAVNGSGTSTLLGGIPTTSALFMDRNRKVPPQIGAVSAGLYYVIDTTNDSLTAIESAYLSGPICISMLDGYGIIPKANGLFQLTDVDDMATIDSGGEGTCEAYPDSIVRSATLEREAVFFGEDSIEWHQNTGASPMPLTRVTATEIGCLSGNSVAKVDTKEKKTLIWVANDHTVRAMSGYGGSAISTNEIEDLIKAQHAAGKATDLTGIAWSDAGRFFYALSCDDWTKVYDAKTGIWHDRKSYGLDRWRVSKVVQFGNRLIAGDYATGQLYTMSDNVYDEAGEPLVAEIITPPVHAHPYPLRFNALYIDAAVGVGLNSTEDYLAEPELMVSWSKDGGYSWSAERTRSLGKLSSTMRRIQPIRKIGACGANGLMFRFRISAPVKRLLMQVSVDFDRLKA